jgi:hypothetical protein
VEGDQRRSRRRKTVEHSPLSWQCWWLAMLVAKALLSRWMAMVVDGDSSSSLLYFVVPFSFVILLVLSTIFFPLYSGLGRCSW